MLTAPTQAEVIAMSRTPFRGFVKLKNGIVIPWLRFADSEAEAIRVVTAQHVHVSRCWVGE